MKNLTEIMKKAEEMQKRIAERQAELERAEIDGQSGGGLVRVTLTGKGALRRVSVDPSLLSPSEKEMVEDLIVAAHADARGRLERQMADEMGDMAKSLGLPPGMKLPF